MARSKTDILQGTLALLVLRTLSSRGSLHGYAITQHIQRGSNELLRVEEGSLYPALHRMSQDGLIKGKWGITDKNREARFYAITAAGKKALAEEEDAWRRLAQGVSLILNFA
ncbi:MAG: transcriptional regulator, PadR family [Gemmatimonadetes bacterium]|nr:transcriptional regulator, PadR family [Gemmatimonadota bacterium]